MWGINVWWLYLGTPVLLFFLGVGVKILVRGGGKSFDWHDWYVGLDLTLLALSSGLLHALDTVRAGAAAAKPVATTLPGVLTISSENANILFIVVCLFLLVLQMVLHQRLQSDVHGVPKPPCVSQVCILGVFANGVGLGLFLSFLLVVKGV